MTNEEMVKNHSAELIEKLVADASRQKALEIRYEFDDNDQWSVITMYKYEPDQEISLRLHADDLYELHFGFYDDDDEFKEISRKLTAEEKKNIPKGLQKVLGKVLADEQGMRLPGSLLSK